MKIICVRGHHDSRFGYFECGDLYELATIQPDDSSKKPKRYYIVIPRKNTLEEDSYLTVSNEYFKTIEDARVYRIDELLR